MLWLCMVLLHSCCNFWAHMAMALADASHRCERDGRYQCQFVYQGKPRTFAPGRVSTVEARAKADQVD